MGRTISYVNARVLEWKCFMLTMIGESGSAQVGGSNPEIRLNPSVHPSST
ncbi:MAG: hypothetical protein ACI8W3_001546 [Myxococcota bacterium]|jgi:hypothetical protein